MKRTGSTVIIDKVSLIHFKIIEQELVLESQYWISTKVTETVVGSTRSAEESVDPARLSGEIVMAIISLSQFHKIK